MSKTRSKKAGVGSAQWWSGVPVLRPPSAPRSPLTQCWCVAGALPQACERSRVLADAAALRFICPNRRRAAEAATPVCRRAASCSAAATVLFRARRICAAAGTVLKGPVTGARHAEAHAPAVPASHKRTWLSIHVAFAGSHKQRSARRVRYAVQPSRSSRSRRARVAQRRFGRAAAAPPPPQRAGDCGSTVHALRMSRRRGPQRAGFWVRRTERAPRSQACFRHLPAGYCTAAHCCSWRHAPWCPVGNRPCTSPDELPRAG